MFSHFIYKYRHSLSNHGYHSFLLYLNHYCIELLLSWTVTVFVFKPLLSWTVTVLNCYCIDPLLFCFWTVTILNYYCIELLLFKLLLSWTVTVLNHYCIEPLLSSEVAFWPLFRFLTISRVLELHFKWDWSRWKAKTRGYRSSEGRRTQFCP